MPLDTSIPLQVQIPQFAEPIDPATRQYNALRQQALQQEMMRNQLIMQNTMEDRRREEANRRLAAATAAAEQRRKEELMGIYSRFGQTPAVIGQRGVSYSGTGMSTNPFEPVRNQLVQKGFLPQAADIAELENKTLTGAKAKAELPGVEAESRKKGAEADKAEFANAFDQMSVLAPYVANGAIPARVAADALLRHPVAGKLLSSTMTREEIYDFADKNPQAVAQILATPPDKIYASLAAPQKYSVQDTAQGIMRVPETGTGPAIPLTGPSGETLMPVDRRSVTNIDMKGQSKFAEELGTLQARKLVEDQDAARTAASTIATINEGRKLLDKGVISGYGADFKLAFAKAAKELGVTGLDGKIESTEAYASNMAKNVGNLIKQFGSGTGLSNADREYAEKMAGGQIALDENSLRAILDMSEKAARSIIEKFNARAGSVKSELPLTVEQPSTASGLPYFTHPSQVKAANLPSGTRFMTPDGEKVVP